MKKLPGLGHVLCVLCFLLPFVQISCNNQKLATVTGVELATGRYQLQTPPEMGLGKVEPQPQSGSVSWPVLIALLCALGAAICAFTGERATALVSMVLGAAGTVALLYFRSGSHDSSPSMVVITVEYQLGFYLALLFMILGTAAVAFCEFAAGKLQSASPGAPASPPMNAAPPAAQKPASAASFCPDCGKAVAAAAAFCDGCGKPLK